MMAINYINSIAEITSSQLSGFFVGWPNPPSPDTHLRLLQNSSEVVLAIDADTNQVIGFIYAISDGVLSAYIPLLEVLPEYQGQGIGSELVRRMISRLESYYMVDLLCDSELQPFYERAGFHRATGMMTRNYSCQSGTSQPEQDAGKQHDRE